MALSPTLLLEVVWGVQMCNLILFVVVNALYSGTSGDRFDRAVRWINLGMWSCWNTVSPGLRFLFSAVHAAQWLPLHSMILHGLASWAYTACPPYNLMQHPVSDCKATCICWGLASSCLGTMMQIEDRL